MIRLRLVMLSIVAVAAALVAGCNPEGPEIPECAGDDQCAVGAICVDGACDVAICPESFDPVCGADGMTYGNACDARAAHVEVAHPGECEKVCGGIAGVPCADGEFCEMEAEQCQVMDGQGVCVLKPEVCTEIYDPVCGCDGKTYSNDCWRQAAGAQKDYDGECM